MASKYPIFANKNPNCKVVFFPRMWFKSKCEFISLTWVQKNGVFRTTAIARPPNTAWPCKQLFSGLILYLEFLDTQFHSWFPNF